ncbi:MAG: tetratricopeptide repeat protein [Deltaproteobacteria bacterium]|nr:MAG: tetratricopeptide repeat protein [Deltaproteobacteria bacterium]
MVLTIWALLLWLAVSGCVKEITAPDSMTAENISSGLQKTRPVQEQAISRVLASFEFSRQGQVLLNNGDPQGAIRMFERAINLDPGNGQNYYYLSEAWLMKNDAEQAEEFNRLAELYLLDDPVWRVRVARQSARIQKLEK